MKSHSIELIVDEPIPGHYCWVLLKHEAPDQNPVPVDYAAGPMPTYTAAMMAGIAALERRAESHAAQDGPNTLH
ncbi:hypothetical protein [Variovorax sp. dw_954]|uniref:hypothetical protein n=1 Tax=Variovorax sp. dw_954 TaxID=2720078 RepID=UPI001BD3F3C4|nr:hypothetical protein [Variovorax sp. dw_954]